MNLPSKIISGAQTGVDRAALDFAIERGIPHGGWCPRGRRAEDGRIHHHYELTETPSDGYEQRTEWNIIEASATLVLYDGRVPMSPGTRKTLDLAKMVSRARGGGPSSWRYRMEINLHPDAIPAMSLRRWIEEISPDLRVLNIAGPRESKAPGIHAATLALLREVWP